ncbi:MAG: thioredoxin family protein [Betaproteobacteria bacterium]|nr:thioredoxin family protein [Betaproteobacteria bacterium]
MSKEIIVFTSAACAPCKQLKPELEFQAGHRGFPLRFIEMSIANQAEFMKYEVRSVPTVVCHDGEKEVGRFLGAMTPTAVESKLAEWGL